MKFEDLEVWKQSSSLCVHLYKVARGIKDFGFRDQLTRSGLSIPSNLAEGHERGSVKEAIHFLYIAKGSCGELRTQIYIGMEIGYIDREVGKNWLEETHEISKKVGSLIQTKKSFLK